ncbi:MAG: hypothetical protein A3J07_01705 [Candidatus Doudnabacteria bacterium RIFCSPLOWO2_02_FULL_49_13]|uniref:Uncharacterized protein n=1 Tax=Candidatus Doudnabacteria bacterium RIFCSPHIGHO2_12_FULL_48_16 TaxID=1817838 RepID=A0A1F5PLB9_9BACT|nr:MAG: hypothetical protein A3B77_01010 [Candidatus Doudnabacteria bacterium RIFCSPHIGHO2_02_FULL_49_24]OGE88822.1 MAG: hypothetical protein A2760_01365 [Candidatus Doudnabacteria bacterium RIFCSPHIGHO2_01_FULL_50_67]OGE90657.1 MAG: hypothetical protein A3E29_00800 [Candidatus Doudnabacteria bacterium RIFCSPHIGHO2_12_FULL_48_16]OGE96989.1 MAG: hypothetical protein A2990_02830 [Candidatus Doudnabacteria bacterium RIFCSPLOWO2_01_FULL_49_40]OGF02523.1 MAG: hypothetical protein A3J07_01705 [Candid
MKTKTKAKAKSNTIRKIFKSKHYQVYYLALAMTGLLVLEGALFGLTTKADWQEALTIFDFTENLKQTQVQLSTVFAPMIGVVEGVNDFYKQATDAAMPLFDLSGSDNDLAQVVSGVTEFYSQSSIQMASLLDLSATIGQGSVAGISIEMEY